MGDRKEIEREIQQGWGVRLRMRLELTWGSRTTSNKVMMFGPPAKFCRILISRLIFFFLTGFKT
jgi:hypothetical protein